MKNVLGDDKSNSLTTFGPTYGPVIQNTGADAVFRDISNAIGAMPEDMEKLKDLKKKIRELTELMKNVVNNSIYDENEKTKIAKDVQSFIGEAPTPESPKADESNVKHFAKKLINAAKNVGEFLEPVTVCVKCIASLYGVMIP